MDELSQDPTQYREERTKPTVSLLVPDNGSQCAMGWSNPLMQEITVGYVQALVTVPPSLSSAM
jgi:hypothetical protein